MQGFTNNYFTHLKFKFYVRTKNSRFRQNSTKVPLKTECFKKKSWLNF